MTTKTRPVKRRARKKANGRPSLSGSGASPKVKVNVPRPVHRQLRREARATKTTVSAVIRALVVAHYAGPAAPGEKTLE